MLATNISEKTLLGAHFSPKRRVFDDFWAPAGSQNEPKRSNFVKEGQHFWRYSFKVVPRVCPETYWDRSGRPRGRSGDSRERFWRHSGALCPRKSVAKTFAKIVQEILTDILADPTTVRKRILPEGSEGTLGDFSRDAHGYSEAALTPSRHNIIILPMSV